MLLSTSCTAVAVLQANKSVFAKRASPVPGTANDSVFPHTAAFAELEEKNDHVQYPYLHQHVMIWSLSERLPKDCHLQSVSVTVVTQGVECLEAEKMVDLALKGYEHLSPSFTGCSGTANSCADVYLAAGLTQM